MMKRAARFLTTDIWRVRARDLPRKRSLWLKPLMILLVAARGFREDKCQLRASALTFYTLLSIVPVLAMMFGIAKGFGLEPTLERFITDKIPLQPDSLARILEFSRSMLETTRGGMIAGVGVALLFWTAIRLLESIEQSFNDIWGVTEGRTWVRKFTDYLAIMLVCPLLFVIASSATVVIAGKIQAVTESISRLGFFAPVIRMLLKLLPLAAIWLLFTFLYVFLPNTRVRLSSGILAGVMAGTLFQALQWAYITFQIGVAKYNAIYGSFAALPLFLIWLQASWLIVLLGAELSFARQNRETYEFEPDCLAASHAFKRKICLRILQVLAVSFGRGAGGFSDERLSRELGIPIRLVRQVLQEMRDAGLVSVSEDVPAHERLYQPARSLARLTIQDAVRAYESRGTDRIPVSPAPALAKIEDALQAFDRLAGGAAENARLEEIDPGGKPAG